MIIYIENFDFQIVCVKIQLVKEFQDSSKQRVNLDKCKTLGSEIFCKPFGEILKPGVNSREILFTQQADQLFFLGIRKISSGQIVTESFTTVKYVLMRKEETVFQGMDCAFVGAVQLPEILHNAANSGIQCQTLSMADIYDR